MSEKPFPWELLCWERSQNIPSDWDYLIMCKLLQWKGHFKFRKQLPQQLGNCVEYFVSMFLVFRPALLEAHHSYNLGIFKIKQAGQKISIFQTCQAMNLILWCHKLSLDMIITSFILQSPLPMKENSWQISIALAHSLFLSISFSPKCWQGSIHGTDNVEALLNAWQL